eukprot:7141179-Pyramimonas_sp.AAC.1
MTSPAILAARRRICPFVLLGSSAVAASLSRFSAGWSAWRSRGSSTCRSTCRQHRSLLCDRVDQARRPVRKHGCPLH